MMNESIKFIIARLIDRANESAVEAKELPDDFNKGRRLAYYEVLDTIKSELQVRNVDLKEYGLDVNLEKTFL